MKKAVDFCHWLKGCLDTQIFPEELDKYQIEIINKKLDEVFKALEEEYPFPYNSRTTFSILPQSYGKQDK